MFDTVEELEFSNPFGFSYCSVMEIVEQYKFFRVIDSPSEHGKYLVVGYRNRLRYIFHIWNEIVCSNNPDYIWSFCSLLKHARCRDDSIKRMKGVSISE